MTFNILLSSLIYRPEYLQRAIADYQNVCTVQVSNMHHPQGCLISLTPLATGNEAARTIMHAFLNYLLEMSLEDYFTNQTHAPNQL